MAEYIDTPSTPFKRGSTFSFLLQLPDGVEDDQFKDWTLKAQLRKQGNSQQSGFVTELECNWVEDSKSKTVRVYKADTSTWPTGLLEMDIVFTAPVSTEDPTAVPEVVTSATVVFDIQREITK